MIFYYPYALFLLCLIPGLLILYLFSLRRKRSLLGRFGNLNIVSKLIVGEDKRIMHLKTALLLLSFLFITIAIARPQYGTKMMMAKRTGVDIMIAIDTSESMNAQDIKPSRFSKAKYELGLLIDKLQGNRIGVIAFAGEAYIECPLTIDYSAAKLFLNSLEVGIIQQHGTAIASAIKKGVSALGQAEGKSKVFILLTDGEDNVGDPILEAKEASKKGVRIYTIGIGGVAGAPIPIRDENRNITGYKKDKNGNTVLSKLQPLILEQISVLTDGKYYRAATGSDELHTIYNDIIAMEKTDFLMQRLTQYEDRFQYFLIIAIIILFVETYLSERSTKGINVKC